MTRQCEMQKSNESSVPLLYFFILFTCNVRYSRMFIQILSFPPNVQRHRTQVRIVVAQESSHSINQNSVLLLIDHFKQRPPPTDKSIESGKCYKQGISNMYPMLRSRNVKNLVCRYQYRIATSGSVMTIYEFGIPYRFTSYGCQCQVYNTNIVLQITNTNDASM